MNRYNGLFNSHFKGCQLLGQMNHVYDGSPISIFALPNEPTLVGALDRFGHTTVFAHRGEAWAKALKKPARVPLVDDTYVSASRPRHRLIVRRPLLGA